MKKGKIKGKTEKPYSNPKQRPKYGENQVDEVWENDLPPV